MPHEFRSQDQTSPASAEAAQSNGRARVAAQSGVASQIESGRAAGAEGGFEERASLHLEQPNAKDAKVRESRKRISRRTFASFAYFRAFCVRYF
jgi:hypothetical protein